MRNREAEALARLLEGGSSRSGEGPAGLRADEAKAGPQAADATPELRALQAFTEVMTAATPRPGDAFKAELRAMLVEEARAQAHAHQAIPHILPRVRSRVDAMVEQWRYSTRVAAASLAAALTFSGGGAVAVAAERALPSDTLYGVKLVLDEARAAVRFDEVAKGERHLDNAAERIDEAEQSVALGDQDGAAVALRESADSARKGARALINGYQKRRDDTIVRTLESFAEVQGRRVRLLAARLDGEAAEAARNSLVVLARIEERLVAIGGTCGTCPAEDPAPDGQAFDFSDIPPADEPFQPCPCEPEQRPEGTGASGEGDSDGGRPAGDEPGQPGDPGDEPGQPDDPGDDEPVPGLPEPVGGIVNELLKPIVTKSAEKGPGGMPSAPSGPAPSLPAPDAPAAPSASPSASSSPGPSASPIPTGGLGLPSVPEF